MQTITFHPTYTCNTRGEYRAAVMLRTKAGRMAGSKSGVAVYSSRDAAVTAAAMACYAIAPALRRDYPDHDIRVA